VTPHLPEHPTDLTPQQRAYLARLRGYAADPPTVAGLWRMHLPRLAALFILFGGLAVLAAWVEEWWAVCFAGGMIAGVLLRDHATITSSVRLWPASAAVVDWDRLDRILGEHTPDRP
jgi:hypothetical protein